MAHQDTQDFRAIPVKFQEVQVIQANQDIVAIAVLRAHQDIRAIPAILAFQDSVVLAASVVLPVFKVIQENQDHLDIQDLKVLKGYQGILASRVFQALVSVVIRAIAVRVHPAILVIREKALATLDIVAIQV